jgi:hypothetical protein
LVEKPDQNHDPKEIALDHVDNEAPLTISPCSRVSLGFAQVRWCRSDHVAIVFAESWCDYDNDLAFPADRIHDYGRLVANTEITTW